VLEHLDLAGFQVLGVGSFNITYTHRTLLRQLGVAERKLPFMLPELRAGMQSFIDELKEQTALTNWKGVQLGADYVIGAKLKKPQRTKKN
jgi:hypothetical protein